MPKNQTNKRPARRRRNTPKPVTEENWDLQPPQPVIVEEQPQPCLCCPDCWDVPCKSCQAGDVCEMIPCACGVLYGKK